MARRRTGTKSPVLAHCKRCAKANVHKLPTIGNLNEWADICRETHNATPHAALNWLTPNLHAELHGPDRIFEPRGGARRGCLLAFVRDILQIVRGFLQTISENTDGR